MTGLDFLHNAEDEPENSDNLGKWKITLPLYIRLSNLYLLLQAVFPDVLEQTHHHYRTVAQVSLVQFPHLHHIQNITHFPTLYSRFQVVAYFVFLVQMEHFEDVEFGSRWEGGLGWGMICCVVEFMVVGGLGLCGLGLEFVFVEDFGFPVGEVAMGSPVLFV